MAASVRRLKEEIAALEQLFPRDHPRVRVVSSGYDEVVIHFIDGRKKFGLTCSGLVSRWLVCCSLFEAFVNCFWVKSRLMLA